MFHKRRENVILNQNVVLFLRHVAQWKGRGMETLILGWHSRTSGGRSDLPIRAVLDPSANGVAFNQNYYSRTRPSQVGAEGYLRVRSKSPNRLYLTAVGER